MLPVQIQLEPRGAEYWVRVDLAPEWKLQCGGARFEKWGPLFRSIPDTVALEEHVLIALGHIVDRQPLEPPSDTNEFIATVWLADALAELENQKPATDAEIILYWASKLFHSSQYRIARPRLRASDLARLSTTMSEFLTVSERLGSPYWKQETHDGEYSYTQELVSDYERGRLPFQRHTVPTMQAVSVLIGPAYSTARSHLKSAMEAIEKEPADMVHAARESILALEALSNRVVGRKKGTLGDAIKELVGKRYLRRPLDDVLHSINGFRGSAPGIMHAGTDLETLRVSELHFVINLAAATILFLVEIDRALPIER